MAKNPQGNVYFLSVISHTQEKYAFAWVYLETLKEALISLSASRQEIFFPLPRIEGAKLPALDFGL